MTTEQRRVYRDQIRQRYKKSNYTQNDKRRVMDVKRSFFLACQKAGIVSFRFHDLRHTFASHLVMAGASPKTVEVLLGHPSLVMTLRYAHLSEGHEKEAVEKLQ